MTIRFPIGLFLLVVLWNQAFIYLMVSQILNSECDTMVDMTLSDP